MRAVILCPGPSLAVTCPSDEKLKEYDITIGVNRAPLIRPFLTVQWWAAGDWTHVFRLGVSPTVGFCTMADVIRLAPGHAVWASHPRAQWVAWDALPVRPRYSTHAALSLAKHLGATHVTMHGDDKEGKLDFDRIEAGADRSLMRWEGEHRLQKDLIAKLQLQVEHVRL